jgi:peptidoglycan/LPS O-acetylase OafA/YrhL
MVRKKLLATILSALMIVTAIIYLIAASQELPDASQEMAAAVESTLFLGSAAGYAITALWILKDRKSESTKPYIVSISGSAFLIMLYIASRTMALPVVGLQDDIDVLDVVSKVLQVAVIATSSSLLLYNKRIHIARKGMMP